MLIVDGYLSGSGKIGKKIEKKESGLLDFVEKWQNRYNRSTLPNNRTPIYLVDRNGRFKNIHPTIINRLFSSAKNHRYATHIKKEIKHNFGVANISTKSIFILKGYEYNAKSTAKRWHKICSHVLVQGFLLGIYLHNARIPSTLDRPRGIGLWGRFSSSARLAGFKNMRKVLLQFLIPTITKRIRYYHLTNKPGIDYVCMTVTIIEDHQWRHLPLGKSS